jgi:hypothetical protein
LESSLPSCTLDMMARNIFSGSGGASTTGEGGGIGAGGCSIVVAATWTGGAGGGDGGAGLEHPQQRTASRMIVVFMSQLRKRSSDYLDSPQCFVPPTTGTIEPKWRR